MTATREVYRKRILNLIAYYRQRGNSTLAKRLQKELHALPIGGVMPEEARPCVAHCGAWVGREDVA